MESPIQVLIILSEQYAVWLLLFFFQRFIFVQELFFLISKLAAKNEMASTSLSNFFKREIGKVMISIFIQSDHSEIKRSLGPQTEKIGQAVL